MNTTLTVLYIASDPSELAGALAAQDWDVHQATSMMDALAMTLYYEPDLIVLDGDSTETRQTLWHLMSATGPSAHQVDLIVSLSDDLLTYEPQPFMMLKRLPAEATPETVLSALPGWLSERTALAAEHHQATCPLAQGW